MTTALELNTKLSAIVVMAVMMISSPLVFASTENTTYSGRAIGVSVDTSIVDVKFADTGELPPSGGELDATVVTVDANLVRTNVLLSVTMGFDNIAESEAAVADVVLLPDSANKITADFVRATSKTTCDAALGQSEIVNLKIAGQDINVSGQPNQTVEVLGVLTLVINEQIDTSTQDKNEIKINALHLTLATGDEVIVSSVKSDISCGVDEETPKDFVTGGGFIETGNGKANFGFVAGIKPDQNDLSGQFNYVDKASGIHLKSVQITSYDGEENTRTFEGTATINGNENVSFSVTVSDNGEPGRNSDEFNITVSNGYSAAGTLAGGNIQLHS